MKKFKNGSVAVYAEYSELVQSENRTKYLHDSFQILSSTALYYNKECAVTHSYTGYGCLRHTLSLRKHHPSKGFP